MPGRLIEKLAAAWPSADWQDVTVVLAVSGGSDSVALLRAMKTLKTRGAGRLLAAHYNHGLRDAAAADEQFVLQICDQIEVPCHVGRGELRTGEPNRGNGLEAAARAARYEFLREVAEQQGARYVVTAHTADDQVETILHRILRGTGLAGLAGIPRVRLLSPAVTVIRPMLSITRSEVEDYLRVLEQPFCQDATNTDQQFTRNRIRHALLPLLERDYNAQVRSALARLGQLAGQAQQVVDGLVDDLKSRCYQGQSAGAPTIDCGAVRDADDYLVRELLIAIWRDQNWPQQDMSFDHWEKLAAMARGTDPGKQVFPGNIVAKKKDGQLTLTRP